MHEDATFTDPLLAQEWIRAIESDMSGSRNEKIYPLLFQWTHDLAPQVVVEIGSGQGICSSKVDISNGSYIGIEPSSLLVARAKELYSEKNKTFLIGDAYHLPPSDKSTDAVFSVGVWFHIKDLDTAHQEIARILKPKGELLIITANPETYDLWESWFQNPKKEGNKLEGAVLVPGGKLSRNIFYLHSEQEIRESLERNSFSIVSVDTFGSGKEHKQTRGIWMAIRATRTRGIEKG